MKELRQDITRNERQARRREREKQWLKENGWNSWEAFHTALLNGRITIHIENKPVDPIDKSLVDRAGISTYDKRNEILT